jgi:hypothetical protein
MPYSAYPVDTDLQSFYKGAGLIADPAPYTTLGWASAVKKAVEAIQRETDRVFLAVNATRTYDHPRGSVSLLNLRADLCSDPTSTVPIVVKVNGATQILNTDYFLGPPNADQDMNPWTWIDFTRLFPSNIVVQRKSIQISGPWGYSISIPDDVWHAILSYAAYILAPSVALTISKGLLAWKEGDEEERYAAGRDAGPLSHEMGEWLNQYTCTKDNLKRVESYF